METNRLQINQFLVRVNNPDLDFAVIMIQEIRAILEKFHSIEIQNGAEPFFVDGIISKSTSKHPGLANEVFRVITLLVQYCSFEMVTMVYQNALDVVYSSGCEIIPQMLSIMKETLTNAVYYEVDRKKHIFNFLYPILTRDILSYTKSVLSFVIDLLACLLEFLGEFASNEQLNIVLEKILVFFAPNCNYDQKQQRRLVSGLANQWVKYTPINGVTKLMNHFLKKEVLDQDIPFMTLSLVVSSSTNLFGEYVDFLIDFFSSKIDTVNQVIAEEGKDMDSLDITLIQDSISSITSLLKVFPDKAKKFSDRLFELMYSYISYGIDIAVKALDDDDDDGGFVDEEMEEEFDDMQDGYNGDDTWRLRKVSIFLAKALIQQYPETFVEYLTVEENVDLLCNGLYDSDIATKLEMFRFVVLLLEKFMENMSKDMTNKILESLIAQFQYEDDKVISSILNSLDSIIKSSGEIDTQFIEQAIDYSHNLVSNQTIVALSSFLSTILDIYSNSYLFIDHICSIIEIVFQTCDDDSIINVFPALSSVYSVANKACPENDSISKLQNSLLDIIQTKQSLVNHSLSLLSQFICLFGNSTLVSKTVDLLIKIFERPQSRKIAPAYLCLVSSSPQKLLLQKHSDSILNEITILLEQSDSKTLFRTLWLLFVCIENKFFKMENLTSILDKIINTLLTGDSATQELTLQILILLSPIPVLFQKASLTINKFITSKVQPSELISLLSSLLLKSIKISQNEVLMFIENIFSTTMKQANIEEDIMKQLAFIIGCVGSNSPKINKTVLTTIQGNISEKNPNVFAIHCFGELGAFSDVSDQTALIELLITIASNNPDRQLFSGAASALGSIASLPSNKVFDRLIDIAASDSSRASIWGYSIVSLTQKLSISKESTALQYLEKISLYLLSDSHDSSTYNLISKGLTNLISVKNDYILTLIAISKEKPHVSNVALASIYRFIADADETLCIKFIPQILSVLDPNNPEKSSSIVSCLISSIKYPSVFEIVIQYMPQIIECIMYRDSHLKEMSFGVQTITQDVGIPLRSSAFQLLSMILLKKPEIFVSKIISQIISSLFDKSEIVAIESFHLLTGICKQPSLVNELIEQVHTLLESIYSLTSNNTISISNERELYSLIANLRNAIPEKINSEFDSFVKKYANNEKFKQEMSEISFEALTKTHEQSTFNQLSVSYSIMKSFRSDASVIFL